MLFLFCASNVIKQNGRARVMIIPQTYLDGDYYSRSFRTFTKPKTIRHNFEVALCSEAYFEEFLTDRQAELIHRSDDYSRVIPPAKKYRFWHAQRNSMYRAGCPVIRQVLKMKIWGVPPGWWAATVATYCPSRPGELPKFLSSKPSE